MIILWIGYWLNILVVYINNVLIYFLVNVLWNLMWDWMLKFCIGSSFVCWFCGFSLWVFYSFGGEWGVWDLGCDCL